MKKNWHQIDIMALNAIKFIIDYCDTKEVCSDCIFHNTETKECSINASRIGYYVDHLEEKQT